MSAKSVKHCSTVKILFCDICTRRKQHGEYQIRTGEARWFPVVFGFKSEHTKLNTAPPKILCERESHSGKVDEGTVPIKS